MSKILDAFGQNLPDISGKKLPARKKEQGLATRDSDGKPSVYSPNSNQNSGSGPSSGGNNPWFSNNQPQAAQPSKTKKSVKWPKLGKAPRFFRNNILPYVVIGLFANNKMQQAELAGYQIVEELKKYELSADLVNEKSPFVAVIQEVTFKGIKKGEAVRDTAYYLLANSARMEKNLTDDGERKTASRMLSVNKALGKVGLGRASMDEFMMDYTRTPSHATLPISDELFNDMSVRRYQNLGVQEYENMDAMKRFAQGTGIADIRADYIIKNRNLVTDTFFPTGRVIFHSSALLSQKHAFKNAIPRNVDEYVSGVEKVNGKTVHYHDVLQEYMDNAERIGLYKIDKEQFAQAVTGNQINLSKKP